MVLFNVVGSTRANKPVAIATGAEKTYAESSTKRCLSSSTCRVSLAAHRLASQSNTLVVAILSKLHFGLFKNERRRPVVATLVYRSKTGVPSKADRLSQRLLNADGLDERAVNKAFTSLNGGRREDYEDCRCEQQKKTCWSGGNPVSLQRFSSCDNQLQEDPFLAAHRRSSIGRSLLHRGGSLHTSSS